MPLLTRIGIVLIATFIAVVLETSMAAYAFARCAVPESAADSGCPLHRHVPRRSRGHPDVNIDRTLAFSTPCPG